MAPTRPPLDTRPTWQKVRIVQHKAILTLKDFVKEPVNYDAELIPRWVGTVWGYLRVMTPEEFEFLKKLSEDVLEIKAMFQKFTTEKKQKMET